MGKDFVRAAEKKNPGEGRAICDPHEKGGTVKR